MRQCSKKAFAMCPTRHLCGSIEEATFADHSECAAFNKQVEDKPMTNADRIRSMTDEELTTLINRIVVCHNLRNEGYCKKCPIYLARPCDTGGLLDWLLQPVNEDS